MTLSTAAVQSTVSNHKTHSEQPIEMTPLLQLVQEKLQRADSRQLETICFPTTNVRQIEAALTFVLQHLSRHSTSDLIWPPQSAHPGWAD